MARIDSKVIFVTTSPRTPAKMVPEIALLSEHFTGQVWDKTTQVAFMECLRDENFFNGNGANDPAFSARDRVNYPWAKDSWASGFAEGWPFKRLALTPSPLV